MSTIINTVISIEQITPHKRNYRSHPDEQISQLGSSYTRFGQFRSVVVHAQPDGSYVQVAGHGIVEAMKRNGATEVRVDVLPVETPPEEVEAILIADNNLSSGASDDENILAAMLQEQQDAGFDLASMGSDEETLRQMLESLGDAYLGSEQEDGDGGDEFDTTPEEGPTRTHVGEIWQLGKHRLYVGDGTLPENIQQLMKNEKASLVCTDPPYGVAYQTKLSKEEAVARHRRTDGLEVSNDAMSHEETLQFLYNAFTTIRDNVLYPGGAFYICSPSGDMETIFRNALDNSGLKLRECLVWVKDQFVMGRQDYHWRHESMLYGWKDGAGHYFVDDRTQDTVWEIPRPKRSEDHPTMKPLELIERQINNSSKPNNIIFDGFLGSGTTLIASHRTGRICYGCDLDPKYADVILRRYEAESNQTAVLLEPAQEEVNA